MNLFYLSARGGGLDTNVRVLVSALVEAGHHVTVLYIHFPGETHAAQVSPIHGCKIVHYTTGAMHYYLQRATFGRTHLPRLLRSLEHTWALNRAVTSILLPPDLIELPEVFTTPRLLSHIPYVVRLHSAAWTWRRTLHEPSGSTDSMEIRMEQATLQRASGISSPSHMLAEMVRAACHLGTRAIEQIPYLVDTTRFVPGQASAREPLVLFVGRVERRKGAHSLLQAIPKILGQCPDCQFIFAGRVNPELEAEIRAHPKVQFLGVQPHENLIALYQRAAVFVAPSLFDNSPNTIYEAMACGTPIVASRVGGIPELVQDRVNGLLVPPGEPDALSQAVISLLRDPRAAARMSACAREQAVANYSVPRVAGQTLDFYQRALAM